MSAVELRYLGFSGAFETAFLAQGRGEVRSIDETLDRAWAVASRLPRSELSMVRAGALEAHYRDGAANPAR